MSERDDVERLRHFAGSLADAAGKAILPLFRQQPRIIDKSAAGSQFDPVTEADRAGERVMREMIGARFPDHGIFGEEFGVERADADRVWYLDPIDGTRSFITGIPLWGILIGLVDRDRPLIGVMEQPFIGERFVGVPGATHYRRGDNWSTLRAGSCAVLDAARFATTDPALFDATGTRDVFERVRGRVRVTRHGTDCYAYAMLAAGHFDLVIEPGLSAYDIVAMIAIVEGAGGVVTTWDGGSASAGGNIIASANRTLHQLALEVIAG